MPAHEYTPEQALALLLRKIDAQDNDLAAQVRDAINAGKDVRESAPTTGRRKKRRVYRRTIPLTQEDALRVALDVLQAYFVEQPLFVSSEADNFSKAAIGRSEQHGFVWQMGIEKAESLTLEAENTEKAVEIELETETQIFGGDQATLPLKRMPKEDIDEQLNNIMRLRGLVNFTEE
jgi:hypothetical protein